MTNEETKKKKTGITPSNPVAKEATDNTAGLIKTAKGILGDVGKAAGGVMSGSVTEAIKAAGETDLEDKITQVKESSEETRRLLEEAKQQQAGESAVIEPEEEQEDGLQRMIREAKMQTDLSMKGGSMIGADPALQSAGQKVRQISAGQAAAVPMSGQTEDKEAWEDFSYLTPQWQLKPEDDTFALTGRVYRVNEDGTAPNWLSVGDQVVTAGGTYVITGYDKEKGNGFHSELLDPNQTTETYQGPYNTGTYGSIIGEQNGYRDDFRGFRDTNGEYTGHGGYSINRQTGQTQFDTVSHTFDGNWTRSAIVEGVPYEMDASGNLIPMEAGSIVQDASQRYWVVGADGTMIDVTPEDPTYDPVADPEGWVGRIQREEAEKAGIIQQRARDAERDIALDPETQAKIRQMQAQVRREEAAAAEANRDLYRQYRLGQEQLGEQLVGAGLHTTGAAERAQADLNAEWIAAMNGNRKSVVDAESEVARQIEAIKLQARQEAQQKQQQEAQQKAAMLAQYGDFSGYSDLGYSPAQIAGMEMFYQQQQAQDNAYGGLSDYAMTILDVYRANPGYDVKGGLQQALDSGLISQQDYIAALQAAAGMSV